MTTSYILPKLTQIPADILSPIDYQRFSQDFLPADVYAHIAGGSAKEISLQRNTQAFDNISLQCSALVDFSQASTSQTLLGKQHALPFMLAPIAYQKLAHPDGELATVTACNAMDVAMISSTLSSVSMEEIQQHSNVTQWFQLYFQPSPEQNIALLRRAEQAGYEAIVVTIDAPVTGLRYRAQRAGFTLPDDIQAANLAYAAPSKTVELEAQQSIILHGLMRQAPTWQDIQWLQENTQLPIILKGICNPADAKRCQAMGLAGIVVSNHGGRALDGMPATIDMLAPIRQAVGDDMLILLDSGIRCGSDIFKALALGANAVLIGRPLMYALSVAGALGVAHMLRLFKEELELTMALAGCPTIASIGPEHIAHSKY